MLLLSNDHTYPAFRNGTPRKQHEKTLPLYPGYLKAQIQREERTLADLTYRKRKLRMRSNGIIFFSVPLNTRAHQFLPWFKGKKKCKNS